MHGEEMHKMYLLLSDSLKYSKNLALVKEKALKEHLKKERKLILVLDLDNTILHSAEYNGFVHKPDYWGRLYKGKDMFQIPISKRPEGPCTHTKFRPFLKQFMEMIHDYFKVYVYTMGNSKQPISHNLIGSYATQIVDFIKHEVPTSDIPDTKIISRDDGHDHTNGAHVKTLRQLSPSDDSFYIILDDNRSVWPESQGKSFFSSDPV